MERSRTSQNANFCRLVVYMCSTGSTVLQQVLLDVVFNLLIADQRKCLERYHSEGKLNVSFPFEKLYPTDGHVPRLEEFDDQTVDEIFHLSHSNPPITASKYLRTIGLQMVLTSHRNKLYKQHKRIGEENWNKIDTRHGNVDITTLDVSLLHFIFRNITKSSGRDWSVMPRKEAVSIEDDVCRIRLFRNELAHYRATRPISDSEFETIWSDLTCALKRLFRDSDKIERDSIEMKSEPIDEKVQQEIEKVVDEWIAEESENVDQLKRHISISNEELGERLIHQISKVLHKGFVQHKIHTISTIKSTKKDLAKLAEGFLKETLTHLKEQTSTILEVSKDAFEKQLEMSAKATKDELKGLVVDSLKKVGSDIETSISAVVKDEVAGMASTLTDPLKQDVSAIMTNCFTKAVQDIEQKVFGIVNDRTINTVEALLAGRLEQLTTYIVSTVKTELIRSSQSDILNDIVGQAVEKMTEANRNHIDTLLQQKAPRPHDGDLDAQKHVQPTDSMKVEVQIWYIENQDFFPTCAAACVVKNIESKKHLTVIGPPLSGKSVIARHTALHMRCNGYTVFPISDPSDIDKFLSKEGKQLFIIDDPLGKNSIDERKLRRWRDVDQRLRKCIENVDVKMIWIMNNQLVREPIFQKSGLIFAENTIDITSPGVGLSNDERRGILMKYLEKTFLEDEDAYANVHHVAGNCDYFFFPEICRTFKQISKWQRTPENPFLFPFENLVDYFDHIQYSSKHQFSAMGLCAIFGKLPSNPQSLQKLIKVGIQNMNFGLSSSDANDVMSALQAMEGIWIRNAEEHLEFSREIYRDVILFLLGKRLLDPSTVLLNLTSRGIRERVRYDPDSLDELPERYVFDLQKEYRKELALRICHDMINLRYEDTLREQYETDVLQLLTVALEKNKLNENDFLTIIALSHRTDMLDTVLKNKPPEAVNTHLTSNKDSLKEQYETDVLRLLTLALSNNMLIENDFLTIIALSIRTENVEMLDTLLKNKSPEAVNIHFKETKENIEMGAVGFSPLHFAVSKSSHWSIDRIVKYSGAVDILSENGLTPLGLAIKNENLQVVSQLIKHGAVINLPSDKGLNPMHFAIELNRTEIVGELVRAGADMTKCTSEDGFPPLHLAIYKRNREMVRKLLELKVDTNICDENAKPPLHFAIEQQEPDVCIIEMLAMHPDTDVNCSNECDHPLYIAVISENFSVVSCLLASKRMEMNWSDGAKTTPLHIAARNGLINIATLLLTYEANVTLTDTKGRTPAQLAREHGQNKMADVIERYLISISDC